MRFWSFKWLKKLILKQKILKRMWMIQPKHSIRNTPQSNQSNESLIPDFDDDIPF